jgi:leucine-zipper of insertion element IS481
VHKWLRRYAGEGGLANLVDRSSRPDSCPHRDDLGGGVPERGGPDLIDLHLDDGVLLAG